MAIIAMMLASCSTSYYFKNKDLKGRSTRYPIVLAHGFNASPNSIWGFNPQLKKALENDGHIVCVTEVSPFNSVDVRAKQLKEQIDSHCLKGKKTKVNIIAHSMGGLDARYLITQLEYGDRVASLITISTPHYGTKIADDVLALAAYSLREDILDVLAEKFGAAYTDACSLGDCDPRAALQDMSEAEDNAAFNNATPNVDGVYYQSWSGVSYFPLKLHLDITGDVRDKINRECTKDGGKMWMGEGIHDHMNLLLNPIEISVSHGFGEGYRPNDGVVTVQSARWGEFQGCIPADHLDEIGQDGTPEGADKNKPTDDTDFNYIRFYRYLAFDLAKRGY